MTRRVLITTAVLAIAAPAAAAPGGPFGAPQPIDEIAGNHPDLNTSSLDGCPIQSPDGTQLFIASDRPGGHGGLDIWVATRESTDEPWGKPENLPAPINSASADFCPTPLRGGKLLFVSRRSIDGVTCGLGDIYLARHDRKHGWHTPRHLECAPAGPNTPLDEQGPSLIEVGDSTQLFFSSGTIGVPNVTPVQGDLFVSEDFGPASPVAELNSPGNDIQPNVRKDGREMVFSSNHAYAGARGAQDLYVSTRESTGDPWSAPVNLGQDINTAAAESRPSLSWHADQLLFGRSPGPEGSSDIFMSTR
jgi:WD40-like Beta Propeller Repeat